MLGLLYIILNFMTGLVITNLCFPRLLAFTRRTYFGKRIVITPALLMFPLWYIAGVLPMTWATYLTAYVASISGAKEPLTIANVIVMFASAVFVCVGMFVLHGRKQLHRLGSGFRKYKAGEIVFAVYTFFFAAFLMWWTFGYQNDLYRVGYSVFSDFAPHLGMIRSFSKGSNIPTSYSHFAGEDIKYHFLFQFMVGNLEYLGMRLDYAFNLPSAICFAGAFCLLYVLAVKLTGKRAVGYIAGLLFAFRSSDAVFDFLSKPSDKVLKATDPEKIGSVMWKAFQDNTDFVGTTQHEDWGLWNLNVYCNQRHLAIGLCVQLIVIMALLSLVFRAAARVRDRLADIEFRMQNTDREYKLFPIEKIGFGIRYSVFSKEGWLPQNYVRPIAMGLLLGMCSFFNGACVIGCLCVLFLLAFVADHRLEYAITAGLTVIMTLGATKFFIDGSVVETKYYFGFLAKVRSLPGVWEYIMTLTGILPFVLLAAFLLSDGTRKWVWAAFAAPFVFAFTVSLTIDITVNHKYVMMSLMLLAIPAAMFIVWLWERRGACVKIAALILVLVMTVTGLYDLRTVLRKNDIKQGLYLRFPKDDPITAWVMENATSDDIFLSPYYSLNSFVMGGAMLYYGWPYYAWSAGYDTDMRQQKVKQMYEARTSADLIQLVQENHIRFIVVDNDARTSTEYNINEPVIVLTYAKVFESGSTAIYDTTKWALAINLPAGEEEK
ncbi:MAG: hypothetical protein IKX54_05700 [Lachnospiraceae bacterium]|nr:hypothetical protein [Lachnospiraceae bacterium]